MILRKAVFTDWDILLEWRNDPETRKNSRNMSFITETSHKKWLQKILNNEHRLLYIAEEHGNKVGSIRADLDNSDGLYELSWNVAPKERGKGTGRKIVKLLTKRLDGKVKACIKKGNSASIKIAEYAGMKFFYEEEGMLYYSGNRE